MRVVPTVVDLNRSCMSSSQYAGAEESTSHYSYHRIFISGTPTQVREGKQERSE